MSTVKANLSVVLKANSVVVAEVEDAVLWQAVLAAINAGRSDLSMGSTASPSPSYPGASAPPAAFPSAPLVAGSDSPIHKLAAELGLTVEQVKGACDPTASEPFLHLDPHHWEAMKKQLPIRGPKALGPIVLAATLLLVWSRHNGMGPVTQAQAQVVLGTIGLRDGNATRSISATEWLQARNGGQVILNPSQISKAVLISKCFCAQDWAAWKSA